MNDNDLQERKAFLAEVENRVHQSDYRTVLALAGARLTRMPGDMDARIAICRVWIQQGRLDEARDVLREMEDIVAGLSQIYASMGDVCLKKGRQEEARVYYRKFIALNPDAPASLEISELLKGIGDLHKTEAEGEAQEAEAEATAADIPSDFQTVTLAELYIRQGHLPMAVEVLEAILRKDPQQEKAAEKLREVREMIGREKSAERYAPVIAELSRWLDHIGRLRAHGV